MAVARFGSGDKIPRQRRFLTSGTWTVPAGVKWVKARIVGAGAAGRVQLNGGTFNVSSIPGVGGAEVIDCILAVTPGASMTVAVAPTTNAPVVTNASNFGVDQYVANGSDSSFGGVTARGGRVLFGVSAGVNSGQGAPIPGYASNGGQNFAFGDYEFEACSGVDGYGAGSGAFVSTGNAATGFYTTAGRGGVAAIATANNIGSIQGVDAPSNTGAGGGSLSAASTTSFTSIRAGNGGSGIVILDWEEYA